MAKDLQDLMANLELSLVETVDRLEQAEMNLLYVGVLDLEQRIEALHDALKFVSDGIAQRVSSPIDSSLSAVQDAAVSFAGGRFRAHR